MLRNLLGNFRHQFLSVRLRRPRDAYGDTINGRIEEPRGRDFGGEATHRRRDGRRKPISSG